MIQTNMQIDRGTQLRQASLIHGYRAKYRPSPLFPLIIQHRHTARNAGTHTHRYEIHIQRHIKSRDGHGNFDTHTHHSTVT